MERKKMTLSFCTIAVALVAIMLIKEERYLSKNKKVNHLDEDVILLGEGAIKILPVMIYEE